MLATPEARSTYVFPNAGREYAGAVYPEGYLSPSQINDYLACPQCFEWDRIRHYPKAMAIDLPIGGSIHKAVEHVRRARIDGRKGTTALFLDEAADVCSDHFDRNLEVDEETGTEILLDLKGFNDLGKAKDAALTWAKFALPLVAELDDKRGLIGAEVDLAELSVDNPYPFAMVGRIDALYGQSDGDHYAVTAGADLKTSKRMEPPKLSAIIQTTIYGEFVGGDWWVDVLAKKREPEFMPHLLTASDEQRVNVHALVMDVAERIAAGDFPPRPGFLCKFDHSYGEFTPAYAL